MAYDRGVLGLQAPIKVRIDHLLMIEAIEVEHYPDEWIKGVFWMAQAIQGCIMYNELLPLHYIILEGVMLRKGHNKEIVLLCDVMNDLAIKDRMNTVAQVLDK